MCKIFQEFFVDFDANVLTTNRAYTSNQNTYVYRLLS
jgi:hypothetical protein